MTALVINSAESLSRALGDEEWRDIPGLEGRYQASSLGRVRSVTRVGATCYGATRVLKGMVLATRVGKAGYKRVGPHIADTQFVHRLVARTFIPNPDSLPVINHIDGNKQNNRVENLEWCTQSENASHAHRVGLSRGMELQKGELSIAAKLTDEQVRCIKRRLLDGERVADIASDYPVSTSAISEIKAGRSWGHIKVGLA